MQNSYPNRCGRVGPLRGESRLPRPFPQIAGTRAPKGAESRHCSRRFQSWSRKFGCGTQKKAADGDKLCSRTCLWWLTTPSHRIGGTKQDNRYHPRKKKCEVEC